MCGGTRLGLRTDVHPHTQQYALSAPLPFWCMYPASVCWVGSAFNPVDPFPTPQFQSIQLFAENFSSPDATVIQCYYSQRITALDHAFATVCSRSVSQKLLPRADAAGASPRYDSQCKYSTVPVRVLKSSPPAAPRPSPASSTPSPRLLNPPSSLPLRAQRLPHRLHIHPLGRFQRGSPSFFSAKRRYRPARGGGGGGYNASPSLHRATKCGVVDLESLCLASAMGYRCAEKKSWRVIANMVPLARS